MDREEKLEIRDKKELSDKIDLADKIVSKKYLYNLKNYQVKPLKVCIAEDIISSKWIEACNKLTEEESSLCENMEDENLVKKIQELMSINRTTEEEKLEEETLTHEIEKLIEKLIEDESKELESEMHYRFLKITRFVYSDDEDTIQKLSTIYSSLSSIGSNIIFIINSDSEKADIYIGVQDFEGNITKKYDVLSHTLCGNFPGTVIKQHDDVAKEIKDIRESCKESFNSLAIVSGVANEREKTYTEKKAFIQGIEKFIDSMKNSKQPYTAIIIADTVSTQEIEEIETGYEELYTSISAYQKSIISTSISDSRAISKTITKGTSESISEGITKTNTHTIGKFNSKSGALQSGLSKGVTESASKVSGAVLGKCIHSAVATLGAATGPIGALIGNALGGFIAEGITKTVTHAVNNGMNIGGGASHSWGTSTSDSVAEAISKQKVNSINESTAEGTTNTTTEGTTLQIESIDKRIVRVLENIDSQLERIKNGEPYGMFNCCAYFMSADSETAIIAANTYKALLMGEKSSVESAAVNYFEKNPEEEKPSSLDFIKDYLSIFKHPVFYLPENDKKMVECSPSSLVNGTELPLYMGMPQKSVNGLPVVKQTAFGRNIQLLDNEEKNTKADIGKIYHMSCDDGNKAWIDKDMLTSHMFITGSTGTGKTNAVCQLLSKMSDVKKLIIEPAKGEYKNKIGKDYDVYGTNPTITKLLKINPFSFPTGNKGGKEPIHVLEHIDRLIDILNACWPMYAAMPAVLKEAIEKAYVNVGWDLKTSKCNPLCFPTFRDVMDTLPNVLNESLYSKDTKSDYMGALLTRVNSLINGINGLIFCQDENDNISNEDLFDKDVIIDISRVSFVETKSMLMGFVVMKLQEYRLSSGNFYNEIKHITVIEEAHNLLRQTSSEQKQESSNLQGKSVEMITNSIAELRAYGESFLIVDQAPGLLDESVIRNTNTKLVFRLPDAQDREIVGKSMALSDNQIIEMTKLPKGVGVLYQNDWIEAVLCKFDKFTEGQKYIKPNDTGYDKEIDYCKLMKYIFWGEIKEKLSESEKEAYFCWIKNLNLENVMKRPLRKALSGKSLSNKELNELSYNLFDGKRIATLLLNNYDDLAAIELADQHIKEKFSIQDQGIVEQIRNRIISVVSGLEPEEEFSERFKRFL